MVVHSSFIKPLSLQGLGRQGICDGLWIGTSGEARRF